MRTLATLALLLLLWIPVQAQTLRVRNNPFEGKVLSRPEGVYAELNQLANALGIRVVRAGEGMAVSQESDNPPPVPAGQVQAGSKFFACVEGQEGELYVPAEAFCLALGGTARRHANGQEVNLTLPARASGPTADAGQGAKTEDFAVGSGPVRRDVPASFFFSQQRSSSNRSASRYNGNCGPTCLAMVALAYDRFPLGISAADRQGLIHWCRKTMTGANNDLTGTNILEVEKAAEQIKLHPRRIMHFSDLDGELLKGRMAIVGGFPASLGFRSSSGKGHWMLIVAKSGSDYIVNDPGLWYRVPGTRVPALKMRAFFRFAVTLGDS